jgi:hypothetical protein
MKVLIAPAHRTTHQGLVRLFYLFLPVTNGHGKMSASAVHIELCIVGLR